jgi:hypothetical protein
LLIKSIDRFAHEKSGLRAAFFRLVICLNRDGLNARQARHAERLRVKRHVTFFGRFARGFHAFEIKWNQNVKARLSKTFSRNYENHQFSVINPSNVEEFLL